MGEQTDRKCGKCGLPISEGEAGIRNYGFHRAHAEYRCIQLMHAEITRLRAELAESKQSEMSAIDLVSRIRHALGDDGKRMQDELIAHCAESKAREDALRDDAERYFKLLIESRKLAVKVRSVHNGWLQPDGPAWLLRDMAGTFYTKANEAIKENAARRGGEEGK